MGKENNLSAGVAGAEAPKPLRFVEVFGFRVPIDNYYFNQGHTWAKVEDNGQVRVGVDDFSQKLFGPADRVELPTPGGVYFQNHVCLALVRAGRQAKFLSPVDGLIEDLNPQVDRHPQLIHEDPYGEGWLCLMRPINLKYNLPNLHHGEEAVAWIDAEAHRLLQLLESKAGATLPDGGTIIDDVYGHFPALDWRRLVQEFLLQDLTRLWKKRS